MTVLNSFLWSDFDEAGWDDASIASYLSSVTNKSISVAELENLLSEEGLARRNPVTGAWEGVLIDVMSDGNDLGDGLEELFSHLNKPRSVSIDTNSSPWAEKAASLVGGLLDIEAITEGQASKIYALAGGKVNSIRVTEEDVAASRKLYQDEIDDQPRKDALELLGSMLINEYIRPAQSGQATVEEVIESIKQGL